MGHTSPDSSMDHDCAPLPQACLRCLGRGGASSAGPRISSCRGLRQGSAGSLPKVLTAKRLSGNPSRTPVMRQKWVESTRAARPTGPCVRCQDDHLRQPNRWSLAFHATLYDGHTTSEQIWIRPQFQCRTFQSNPPPPPRIWATRGGDGI